jgi:hypothetical protein
MGVESLRSRLELVRQRLLASVPDFVEMVWDVCTAIDMRSVRLRIEVGDYRLLLVDPLMCKSGRSFLRFRDALAVAVAPHEPRRVLWFRAIEAEDSEKVGRLEPRMEKVSGRFAKLFEYPPDLIKMLSEACESVSQEPQEVAGALKLLEYDAPFAKVSLTVSDAVYRCKAGGKEYRVLLRGVIQAVAGRARVLGFQKAEVSEI